MEISRKRIRKDYAPLTVSVGIACTSGSSPMVQVYNAGQDEYEPDRSVSPAVVYPQVTAYANDGSWPDPVANRTLTNMRWYANGVDISTIASWAGKYEIDDAGATKGTLTIYRNVAPSERIELQFKADLVDSRLGVTIPVVTPIITMSTLDKSDPSWSASVSVERNIRYNVFLDKLLLYRYKVAHGLQTASAAAEAAARDGVHEYERRIDFQVYMGGEKQTSGFTVNLYRISTPSSMTQLSTADDEVVAITTSYVTLDLRLIQKADYMLKFFVDGTEMSRVQFSVSREYQSFTCEPSNGTPILPGQTERYDEVVVDSDGVAVECPESIIRIVWYTDTAHKTNVEHNEGGKTVFQLDKTGIGDTSADDWLDVFISAIQKEPYCVAVDGSGDIYTDENGDDLIFN